MAKPDELPIILGVVATVLFIICAVLIIFICRRRLKDREQVDRVNKHLSVPEPNTGIAVQENPQSGNKESYYNFGQVHDNSKTDAPVHEIKVETSVVPYHYYITSNGDNNNNNNNNPSCSNGQSAQTGTQTAAAIIGNGSVSSFHDSYGSQMSVHAKSQDNCDTKHVSLSQALPTAPVENGGFQDIGVRGNSLHQATIHPDESVVPSSQKQESAAHF